MQLLLVKLDILEKKLLHHLLNVSNVQLELLLVHQVLLLQLVKMDIIYQLLVNVFLVQHYQILLHVPYNEQLYHVLLDIMLIMEFVKLVLVALNHVQIYVNN